MISNIGDIIGQPLAWFEALLTASGTMGIFVSAITIFLIVRYVILPFTGGSVGRGKNENGKGDKK